MRAQPCVTELKLLAAIEGIRFGPRRHVRVAGNSGASLPLDAGDAPVAPMCVNASRLLA
jgi:hypothetical protein